jgi:hypothetical protein
MEELYEEEFNVMPWLDRLIRLILEVRDDISDMTREEMLLEDESTVVRMSDSGIAILEMILRLVVGMVRQRMVEADRRRWLQRTHMMRLVDKQWGAAVDWYATVDPMTGDLRSLKSRQKRIDEFFQPVEKEVVAAFLVKGKDYIDEWSWNDGGEIPMHSNVYDALELDDQSCGNDELDRRAGMNSEELMVDLKEGRERRRVRDDNFYVRIDMNQAFQNISFEEEELEDEEEEEVLEGRSVDGSFESVSGTDSEYWAAMDDPDLSDATIQSSSDSDFH